VADLRTSLIFIKSLIFMVPTAVGSWARWAPQASGMGCSWAASSKPQRPAYSGRGHIVSPRAQLVTNFITFQDKLGNPAPDCQTIPDSAAARDDGVGSGDN